MAIVFVGFRGSGKTTVGRIVADRLKRRLVDTDDLIVEAAGMPICDIFAAQGETGFRDLESDALRRALENLRDLISTGGGIVIRRENRDLLRKSNRLVVYLRGSSQTLYARIASDANSAANRPSLTALGGGLEEVEHLLLVREPLYREVAHLVIDVDDMTPEQVADAVMRCCTASPLCG